MTIGTNQFWTLLKESRLVELSRIHSLNRDFLEKFEPDANPQPGPKQIAQWLVSQKVISAYQAEILLAGHSGPMIFGRYVVTGKIDEGPRSGTFKAMHEPTEFPVNLQFVKGVEQVDLQAWKQIEALSDQVCGIVHPNLVSIYESVSLPGHRFIASESSTGTSLSVLVPRRGRLPWKDACSTMAQVAQGLQILHDHGIVHNSLSPQTIWISGSGRVRLMLGVVPAKNSEQTTEADPDVESRYDFLAPETYANTPELSPKSDLYSIGCTLYRMISGRAVFPEPDLQEKLEQHLSTVPADLGKYELPARLQNLLDELLSKAPEQRPPSSRVVAEQLADIAGKPDLIEPENQLSTAELGYRDAIKPWKKGADQSVPDDEIIAVDTGERSAPIGTSSARGGESTPYSTNRNWRTRAAVLLSSLVLAGIIGLLAYQANHQLLDVKRTAPTTDPRENPLEDPTQRAPANEPPTKPDLSKVNLVQDLIDDDGTSLWESPTTGKPIDFSYVPPTPKLIFVFRPSEILAEPEGERLLQSLGPQLSAQIADWRQEVGLEFDDILQIIISFHTTDGFEYDPFFVVRLTNPVDRHDLSANWKDAVNTIVSGAELYQVPNDRAFYIVPEPETDDATQFLFGEPQRLLEVIQTGGATVFSGAMNKLSRRTDSDRHFSLLFLRQSLFNEQGQSWMSGQMATFNRQLDLLLQDEIRGGLVSMHLDDGTYLEITFDQTADLEALELKTAMEQRLRTIRDALTRFITTIPASPFWDKVRLKYDNMLSDAYRQFRWGVEYKTVIGNCWLPPMAGHNLIAASELLTAFSTGTDATAAPRDSKKTPRTIEELLAEKRSLDISTNPDLNILLSGIQAEVIDDHDPLPFEFNIRLIGNDLEKEGITQNQRPGDFKIKDKTLAEILTEIMVRCNPSKNIDGPSDPECKLVWAIGPDPANVGQRAILITTREGADEKGLTLPDAFVRE